MTFQIFFLQYWEENEEVVFVESRDNNFVANDLICDNIGILHIRTYGTVQLNYQKFEYKV